MRFLTGRRSAVILIFVTGIFLAAPSISGAEKKTLRQLREEAHAQGRNDFYPGNQEPLSSLPFIRLPIGSVQPQGWLREQLLLLADGFTGHLSEISEWCKFEGNAWTHPQGEGPHGWEELPYWLKGFVDLGYILHDKRIMAESKRWIDAILGSQQTSGYFGSKTNLASLDIWPNMIVLFVLRSHYEATQDPRVIPFMTKYFRWLATVPPEKLLSGSWQKWRGGDNLDSIYWLYNHAREPWLLDLAERNHEKTADWTSGIPTWHGVNLTQGFREPAQYFQQSHDQSFLNATFRNYSTIMAKYGQVPGGMFGADENAREGHLGPRQGAETCSMAEFMASDQMLLGITGDRVWADRCEDIAFNSFPASMTADLKGLHYLTAPNQIQLDRTNKAPMIENEGDMFSYNPHGYRCCQHNAAFGWPYFAEHLWMATPGNGLAAVMYAPSMVVAKVGRKMEVRITETTDYPFSDKVTFTFSNTKPVRFPFRLRIPGWCHNPKVTLNGYPAAMMSAGEGWVMVDWSWKKGDKLELHLPMPISVRVWEKNGNGVSIDRGPLTYSLRIGEKWQRSGGTDRWPAFEVFPTGPWNYALQVNKQNPASSFTIAELAGKFPQQPFTPANAPVLLKAKGRKLPTWRQETNGMVGDLPAGPVSSAEPLEELTLIPMGAARLRISVFPQLAP